MQSVLVTGGAGFIGSHTVIELVKANYRPVIIDNFSNSEKFILERLDQLTGQPINHYEQNYQDIAQLAQVIKDENISGIIHFAASKAVGESVEQPLKYYDNNVSGFVALLQTALDQDVHNFVLSSSAAVYGSPPVSEVTEDTACQPTSPYGWSKFMDEVVLRDTCAANPKLRGVSLRYFNVVGAHESTQIGELPKGKPQNLLPIIVQAVAGKLPPVEVYGTDYPTPDGTCQRDYIHVVDLAKAHVAALDKVSQPGTSGYSVYNIGTGKPTSVLELIKTFERVNKVKVPHKLGKRRAGDPVAYFASPKQANSELGWQASKTVDDAVRDAWHWQQTLTL